MSTLVTFSPAKPLYGGYSHFLEYPRKTIVFSDLHENNIAKWPKWRLSIPPPSACYVCSSRGSSSLTQTSAATLCCSDITFLQDRMGWAAGRRWARLLWSSNRSTRLTKYFLLTRLNLQIHSHLFIIWIKVLYIPDESNVIIFIIFCEKLYFKIYFIVIPLKVFGCFCFWQKQKL